MHPILIFKHVETEGPGYLGDFLTEQGLPFKVISIEQGQRVPENLDKVSALVFMGGSMSVNDPLDWINDELQLIRRAQERALPMLGHCLGAQLISKALGGEVRANPVTEIGWHNVSQKHNSSASNWLKGLATEFEVFHWHSETFSIPAGAELILSSRFCENQAFVIGKSLALQCHIEMTEEMVNAWVKTFRGPSTPSSVSVQTSAQMLEDLHEKIQGLQALAKGIYTQWLRGLE